MSRAWPAAMRSATQALAEIERLRAEADDIARWIVEQWGYPIEVGTEKPPSEPWRRRIEDAWIERQQPMDPGNDEDIRLTVGIEGGWVG